jgi:predicted Zn-dependent peptidase
VIRARWFFLAALGLTTACGDATPQPQPPPAPTPAPPVAPASTAASIEFRKTPPPPGAEPPFVPPNIQEARLANGVRILLVERHDLPVVAVQIVMDRGAAQAASGVGAFVGGMLLAGTRSRPALKLSDELEQLGATYGAWVGYDGSIVQGECLRPKLSALMTIFGDVVQSPAFAKDELERERSRRLTALAQENDRPATLLSNTVAKLLYPAAHPYSTSLLGTEEALKKIGPLELARFHAVHFAPDVTTVAIAGDITKDAAVAEVERVLGKWKGKAKKAVAIGDPPPATGKEARIVLVDRPGATQSNVAVALPGVPRSNKDFDALLVMNTILGGQFSSRLNMNLREKHAMTYGARSGFDMRQGPGPFSAGGAIFRDKTDAAVREILSEMERMRSGLVTEEELTDAKSSLIKQLPARFETVGETASTLSGLAIYALPLDEFATRPTRIGRVTADDVRRVAETYLKPDRARVVVVGDAAGIKQGLSGLSLGEVEMKTPPGSTAPKPAATPGTDTKPAPTAAPGGATPKPPSK